MFQLFSMGLPIVILDCRAKCLLLDRSFSCRILRIKGTAVEESEVLKAVSVSALIGRIL
jgi:hypothetical protein